MSAFHSGEVEVQLRLRVREDAERVGRILSAEIPRAVRPLLSRQRMAVAASLDAEGRPWASLLAGPEGFLAAADERLLRIAATLHPDDPLAANLRARPELGLLVIDPRTRQRRGPRTEDEMAKHIGCSDVVSGRGFTAEAATEAELVEKVKAHAAKDHGVFDVDRRPGGA